MGLGGGVEGGGAPLVFSYVFLGFSDIFLGEYQKVQSNSKTVFFHLNFYYFEPGVSLFHDQGVFLPFTPHQGKGRSDDGGKAAFVHPSTLNMYSQAADQGPGLVPAREPLCGRKKHVLFLLCSGTRQNSNSR